METRKTPSWNEVLSGFIQCSYKAYLELAGQRGRPPDIARCLSKRAKRHRRVATQTIRNSFARDQIFDGRTTLTDALRSRTARLVTNVTATYEGHAVHADALLLEPLDLGDKRAQAGLLVCFAEEKLSKQHKRWAACVGHLMSRAIGLKVPAVTMLYGDALRQTKVRTADPAYKAASTCAELLKLMTAGDPPKLRLNGHCSSCAFQRRCRAQAEKNDDLSLMPAITEREIARLNAKGIFTVAQYSYTYRPRRRRKGAPAKPGKHNLALQALAKRTDTIYVAQRPELPPADTAIYLDLEGVPDRNFYYLLGMQIVSNGQASMRSFWADSQVGERALWEGFIRTLMPLSRYVVFHYGAYDTRALRTLAKRYGDDTAFNQEVQVRCFNVLSSIHGHIHFPTLSNGLKPVAGVLGFSWSEQDASGIQSLARRLAWEEQRDSDLKERLITYNAEDCGALEVVTQTLRDLSQTDANKATLSLPVAMEESLSTAQDHVRLLRKTAAFPELVRINECSYYEYQRDRVEIRTSSAVRKKFDRERRKERHCLRVDRRVVLTGDGVYTPKNTGESKQSPKKEPRNSKL